MIIETHIGYGVHLETEKEFVYNEEMALENIYVKYVINHLVKNNY